MTGPTKKEVRDLATRAVRLAADEMAVTSFSPPEPHVEKALANDYDFVRYLIWLAKEDEREACAKVCDELPAPDIYNVYNDTDKSMWDVTCMDCATAIRARGQA